MYGPLQRFAGGTWLQDEAFAYPNGGQTRKGSALYPDGKVRRVWAGIPDTYFSIPAHGRIGSRYVSGYLSVDDHMDSNEGTLVFRTHGNTFDDAASAEAWETQ